MSIALLAVSVDFDSFNLQIDFVVLLFCSLDTCKALVGTHVNIIENVESKDLKRVLYELCWAGVNGQLKVDQIIAALADVAVS